MAAQQRFSRDQILQATYRWRGNVTAAASDLGMSKNNFRKRLELMGVSLVDVRRSGLTAPPTTGAPLAPPAKIPIKVTHERPMVLRVPPVLQGRLRDARFDLCARYRAEITEEAILSQFFEDAFAGWLASKLEPRS